MSATLELEEAVELHQAPKLLVEWSSPWREFVTAIRPALARSEARLAGEAPFGLVPYRIMLPSYFLEAFLIFAAIALQVKIRELRPYVAPRPRAREVIYYSGIELPRTEDLGGAEMGRTGRAGGQEANHPTQTIKIARGGSLVPKVLDAPNLKLPPSHDSVANLLAIQPDPGPPPSEGLRSGRKVPNLQATVVEPAPNVIHDYTRNGVTLDSVILPAPSVSRDQPLTAPNLSAAVIPPAPSVNRDHALVAPVLVPNVAAPAPAVSRDHPLAAPSLAATVIAPAPSINSDKMRSAPPVSPNVIPPAPAVVTQQLSGAPVQMTEVAVVPPPVSAPERALARPSKVALPAPSLIAPPPSTDVSQDARRLAAGNIPDPSKTVVPPPPPTQSSSGGFMSSLIGKFFGASEVVPPPPTLNSTVARAVATNSLPTVVPPPAALGTNSSASSHTSRAAPIAPSAANVIAPPSAGVSGGVGTRTSSSAPMLGPANVVPPPPAVPGSGTGNALPGSRASSGTLLANNIVSPPPAVSGDAGSGSGLGRKGVGLGTPMNAGSNLTPPSTGGSGANAGAVVSNQPGSKIGLPATGQKGVLAMSPSGGDKPGLGGSGGGSGIVRGTGPGSSVAGDGSGAGKTGSGHGADADTRGGISPMPGPGGTGNAATGVPPVPGVSVSGGTAVVTLPSFGDADPGGSGSPPANRTNFKPAQTFGVDVVGTASAFGAFEPYKNLLRGEKHVTNPVPSDFSIVMEYAEESPTVQATRAALSPPAAIRADLPQGLPRARMMVACTLDASGNLKNLRVLEKGPGDMTAKVIAALYHWKFQPAARGGEPVEVTVILGFGIDTNDHF